MNKIGLYWLVGSWPHLVYAYGEKRSHYAGAGKTLFRDGRRACRKNTGNQNGGYAGMGRNTFANGARILAFSNDTMTDTTDICDDPYAAGVEWLEGK